MTSILILNLAVNDLLYCIFILPMYVYTYFHHHWELGLVFQVLSNILSKKTSSGKHFCIAYAYFKDAIAYSEWMALGMIALTRYYGPV